MEEHAVNWEKAQRAERRMECVRQAITLANMSAITFDTGKGDPVSDIIEAAERLSGFVEGGSDEKA